MFDSLGIALPIAVTFTAAFLLFLFLSVILGVVDDMLSIFDFEIGGGLYFLSFMTISGLLGGVAIGAWTYLYLENVSEHPLIYSLIAGLVACFATGALKQLIFSAGSSGELPEFKINVGDVGTVYILVNPNGEYGGQATFSDKYHRSNQVNVLTNSPEPITNGRQVEVVDIKGSENSPVIYVIEHK
jgi:hypothetical protein